jgi:hypothetical protein
MANRVHSKAEIIAFGEHPRYRHWNDGSVVLKKTHIEANGSITKRTYKLFRDGTRVLWLIETPKMEPSTITGM